MNPNRANLIVNKSGEFTLCSHDGNRLNGICTALTLTDASKYGMPIVHAEIAVNIHHSEQDMLDYIKENKEKPY